MAAKQNPKMNKLLHLSEPASNKARDTSKGRSEALRSSSDRALRPSRLSSTLALALWKDVTVASVAGDMPDLSARQTAVLMCVYLEEGPHTVRSLAARLNVTKAVISRAIDRLKSYNYIVRADDPRDGRSIVLRRTPDGINYLRAFAQLIQKEMPAALSSTSTTRR